MPKLQLLSSLSDALCARCVWGGRGNPTPLFVARPVLIENVKAAEKTYIRLPGIPTGKIWPGGEKEHREEPPRYRIQRSNFVE